MTLPSALTELAALAARCVESAPGSASAASDDALLDLQRSLAQSIRLLETAAASVAAEVAHRSRRELGYQGLAQKRGLRTPEALVQTVTGASSSAARRLVRVGTLVAHSAGRYDSPAEPWLAAVLAAAGRGEISAEAVDAIRLGLGAPTEGVSADALAAAARELLGRVPSVTLENLASLAREKRDGLDAAGVALREHELRQKRFARLTRLADGTTRLVAVLDPESAAVVVSAIDAATSPRRGGPRFVDPQEIERAERLMSDERTTEQIALDALVELIDVAVRGESSHILGARRPEVRVLVAARDLTSGVGAAQLEGQSVAISIPSAQRLACDGGIIPILFDAKGAVLNLGRKKRLHSDRQRVAVAARDGGCRIDGCDRPPSWTEVHHIVPWSEGGRTSVDDAVLLCRHHHLLVHNNGWAIHRTGREYWLYPPPGVADPPVLLESKSRALRRLLQAA